MKQELKKIFPHEYGAWAMWIVPFLAGTQAAGAWNIKTLFWFIILTGLYLFKNPFVEWVLKKPGISQPNSFKKEFSLISIVSPIFGLIAVIWFLEYADLQTSIIWGGIFICLSFAYLYLDLNKKGRTLTGQWIGVFLLTLAAPLTYIILGGKFVNIAFLVWSVNILYFAHSIYTVQGWMNSRRRSAFSKTKSRVKLFAPLFLYWGITIIISIFAVYFHWITYYWLILLIPTTLFILLFTLNLYLRVTIKQIGFLEIGHTLTFIIILMILLS